MESYNAYRFAIDFKGMLPALLSLIFLAIALFLAFDNYFLRQEVEKFDLFYLDRNQQEFHGGEVTGLAYGDFFAVWTKGRSIQEVMGTCLHEYAHNELDMVHSAEGR